MRAVVPTAIQGGTRRKGDSPNGGNCGERNVQALTSVRGELIFIGLHVTSDV